MYVYIHIHFLCICVYMHILYTHIYIHICVCVCICIYNPIGWKRLWGCLEMKTRTGDLRGPYPTTQFRGDGLGQEVGRQWLRTKGEAVR